MSTSPFDALAREYDADFTDTAVGKVLREMVWSRLDVLFGTSGCVLELGCGTGEDAIRLAQRGVQVVASDASKQMTEVARHKALHRRGGERIEFHHLAMEEVVASLRPRRFDGVFSNFGAINCVRDLAALAAGMSELLEPGAPLLWVIMGQRVPWEWLWYLSRGQGRKALRRYRRDGTQWRGLKITYPTPARVAAALQPFFTVTRLAPLGCLLPPSYAAGWLNRRPRLLARLAACERRAQSLAFLASWADHYILEARRLPPSAR